METCIFDMHVLRPHDSRNLISRFVRLFDGRNNVIPENIREAWKRELGIGLCDLEWEHQLTPNDSI